MTTAASRLGVTFDLVETYLQLEDGPAVKRVDVDDRFWEEIASRPHLHDGRLVGVFPYRADWDTWEMHPAGDEIVCLLSGAVDLVLDQDGGERVIELRGRAACIVPQGVWHTADVHQPGDALHVTRGAGTQHRPR